MDRETRRIEDLLEPSLEAMGYELVRISLNPAPPGTIRRRKKDVGEGQGRILQIMAERQDRVPMSGGDCTEVSRAAAAILDVEDPIAGSYVLEVSSPGIDRPLVKPEHFRRFEGHEAKIELAQALDGRKRFRGTLAGVDGENVKLVIDGTGYLVPIPEIQRAKLVLTDALLKARAPARGGDGGSDERDGDGTGAGADTDRRE